MLYSSPTVYGAPAMPQAPQGYPGYGQGLYPNGMPMQPQPAPQIQQPQQVQQTQPPPLKGWQGLLSLRLELSCRPPKEHIPLIVGLHYKSFTHIELLSGGLPPYKYNCRIISDCPFSLWNLPCPGLSDYVSDYSSEDYEASGYKAEKKKCISPEVWQGLNPGDQVRLFFDDKSRVVSAALDGGQ